MQPSEENPHVVYADPDENGVTVISSLCMCCMKEGTTRFLLTSIPHFKDVIISAFECPHCLFTNNELQSASTISEKGCTYTCLVTSAHDLNRQVVKSEYAKIVLNELDLELPPTRNKGYLSTIEGVLNRIVMDLGESQETRKPDVHEKLQAVIERVREFRDLKTAFTFTLEDPAGCSYIESRNIIGPDTHLKISIYDRSKEQQEEIGFAVSDPDQSNDVDPSVFCFPATCSSCGHHCDTKMHMVNIPFFKDVLIMATVCDRCGYKSNEVKSGGDIPEKGKRISLKITSVEDLSRDILKSDSCSLEIPEIELTLSTGTLGGRFTTIEGLLVQVHDELYQKCGGFASGDSATSLTRARFEGLLNGIQEICAGRASCTLILDDPLAASYIQNLYAPDPDPNMSIELYERSFEQNEDFGLNDIKVENYQD